MIQLFSIVWCQYKIDYNLQNESYHLQCKDSVNILILRLKDEILHNCTVIHMLRRFNSITSSYVRTTATAFILHGLAKM